MSERSAGTADGGRRRSASPPLAVLAGCVALAHAALVARWLGARPLLDGAWPCQIDFGVYLARSFQARELWLATGRLAGWHPAYAAGSPAGTLASAASRLPELTVGLSHPLPPAPVFTWTVALMLAAIPWLAIATVRRLGGGWGAAAWAAVLSTALTWGWLEEPQSYLFYGMFAWTTAMAVAPPLVVAVARLLDRPTTSKFLAVSLAASAGWLVHLLLPVLMAPAVVGICAADRRRWRRDLLSLGALVSMVAVLSSFWIVPWLLDSQWRAPGGGIFLSDTRRVARDLLVEPRYRLLVAVVLLGLLGLRGTARRSSRRLAAALAAGAAGAAFLGLIGDRLPGGVELEPARFIDAAALFLLAPAAIFLAERIAARPTVSTLAAMGLLLVALAPAAGRVGAVARGEATVTYWSESDPDERIPGPIRELVDKLRRTSPAGHRVLVEDSIPLTKLRVYREIHLPALLPWLVERPTVGGPIISSRVAQHRVTFASAHLLGRPLASWSDAELAAALDLYDIGWIAAWSDAARTDLARRAILRRLESDARFPLFEYPGAPGFVIGQPAAGAMAGAGRIEVSGALLPTTRLRFHCGRRMRSEPPLAVRCVHLDGAALPMIEVDNGAVERFVVRFGAGG